MIIRLHPREDMEIELSGDSMQQLWRQLVSVNQVFGVTTCGNPACGSEDIFPSLRPVKTQTTEFDAYEWRCHKCNANIGFGLNKEGGGMFLRWDDKWYVPETQGAAAQQDREETPF